MKTFEFWFDFGSPAAYLAFTQLQKLENETNSTAVYRPMLLGGVFQATGNHSPATIPAKGSYIFGDFNRFAKRYGVPFNSNPHFPINTLLLMRGGDRHATATSRSIFRLLPCSISSNLDRRIKYE